MKFKIIANEQTPKIETSKLAVLLIREDIKLLEKFISFARRQHNCVGLAANQVSVDGKRIMETFFAIKNNHIWDIIINPQIIEYRGKVRTYNERCLTWLGKDIEVKRYSEIVVKFYTLKGEFISKIINGWEAQVWQHEYNHLMGIEEKINNSTK